MRAWAIKKRVGGFSFLEIMVAVGVLAVGISFIYKAFFTTIDYLTHLKIRLYANAALEQKIANVQYFFKLKGELPDLDKEVDTAIVNNKSVSFQYSVTTHMVDEMPNVVLMELSCFWPERNRTVKLARSMYLARF